MIVFGGGIIPKTDRQALFSCGIKAIFGPGTSTAEILSFIEIASEKDGIGVGESSDWYWQGV